MKKIWCIILIALLLLNVGCAEKTSGNKPPELVETPSQTEPASQEPVAVEPVSTEILHASDWLDKYPEVYESFKLGASVVKDDGSNRTHSHANLTEACEISIANTTDKSLYANTVTMRCLFCKTADSIAIYEKYGDEAYSMEYNAVIDMVEDMWGCYMCHENDPGNTITATIPFWVHLNEGASSKVSAADSTCGQCHNMLGAFRDIKDLTTDMLTSSAPYKYGYEADSIRKAVNELGIGLRETVDEDTGLVTFSLGHPDVEIFQDSTHHKQGMSCYSCHMPKTTKDGVTFTSHDASGSPLKNEAALNSCLECHSNGKVVSAPVDSTDNMVKFVQGKQSEIAVLEDKVNSDVEKLYDLVLEAVNSGATDAELELAREAYTTAKYYSIYCRSSATESGLKAPHDYNEMKELLTKAQTLLDEAIGSL